MIPAAPFKALHQVAKSRSSAHHAGEYMSEIQALLAESLPRSRPRWQRATTRPGAARKRPRRNLVLAGGKRVRPLTSLLVNRAVRRRRRTRRAARGRGRADPLGDAAARRRDGRRRGAPRPAREPRAVGQPGQRAVRRSAADLGARARERSGVPGAMDDTLATMRALIAGEVAQLKARGRDDLGIDGYLEIARGKTASLFACACRLGARAAGAAPEADRGGGPLRRARRHRVPDCRRRARPRGRPARGRQAPRPRPGRGQDHAAARARAQARAGRSAAAAGRRARRRHRRRRQGLARRPVRAACVEARAFAIERDRARPARARSCCPTGGARAARGAGPRPDPSPRVERIKIAPCRTNRKSECRERIALGERADRQRHHRPPDGALGLQAQHGPRLDGAVPGRPAAQRQATARRGCSSRAARCR